MAVAKITIPPFTHTCTIHEGAMAGNTHHEAVHHLEIGTSTCEHCGELLATTAQITAHIYEYLAEDV